jgi:hypothetical protein
MAAYVLRYSNRDGPLTIEYDDGTGWRMDSRSAAELHCRILRELGVHVGKHCCEFSVVELDRGEFAIVCLSHPEYRRFARQSPGLIGGS